MGEELLLEDLTALIEGDEGVDKGVHVASVDRRGLTAPKEVLGPVRLEEIEGCLVHPDDLGPTDGVTHDLGIGEQELVDSLRAPGVLGPNVCRSLGPVLLEDRGR
jgi:hypothetical protein